MTAWPEWMPCALMAPYSYQRKEIVLRTSMDTGKMRSRRVFENGPATATLEWIMDRGQMAYFEWWYQNTIQSGASPFTILLNTGSYAYATDHEVQFLEPYSVKLLKKDLFHVSAPMYVTQIQLVSDELAGLINAYAGDLTALNGFIDIFDTYVNFDLPASEMGA